MDEISAVDLVRSSLFVAAQISLPLFATALFLGFTISLFQALTQITDISLMLIPKLLAVGVVFAVTFPWMLKILTHFTINLLTTYWEAITITPRVGIFL